MKLNMVYRNVTCDAIKYIKGDKAVRYGFNDDEFVNGYKVVAETVVTTYYQDGLEAVWYFDKVEEEYTNKIGYIVSSWRNQLDMQVSKETGNKAFQLIIDRARKYPKDMRIEIKRI